jgi:hypothetical protein
MATVEKLTEAAPERCLYYLTELEARVLQSILNRVETHPGNVNSAASRLMLGLRNKAHDAGVLGIGGIVSFGDQKIYFASITCPECGHKH